MHPPIGNLLRTVSKDYKVPGTNTILYRNQPIFIPTYAIQHDPEYYPNPEEFLPERFLPDEMAKRTNVTYLPFGEGPRNCIGERFGKMQTRIGLVTLLKQFKFTDCSKTLPKMIYSAKNFIMSPEGGMWLHMEQI